MKTRVVRLPAGKYAAQYLAGAWPLKRWKFISRKLNATWTDPVSVHDFCVVDTAIEAIDISNRFSINPIEVLQVYP